MIPISAGSGRQERDGVPWSVAKTEFPFLEGKYSGHVHSTRSFDYLFPDGRQRVDNSKAKKEFLGQHGDTKNY